MPTNDAQEGDDLIYHPYHNDTYGEKEWDGQTWSFRGEPVIIPDESEDRSSAAEKTIPFSIPLTPPKDGEAFFIGTDGERHPMLPARNPIISDDPATASSRWRIPPSQGMILPLQGTSVPPPRFLVPPNVTFSGPAEIDPSFVQTFVAPPVLDAQGRIVPGEYHASARINIERVDFDGERITLADAPEKGSRVTFNYTYAPQTLPIWKRFLNRCSLLFACIRAHVLH